MTTNEPHDDPDDFETIEEETTLEITIDDLTIDAIANDDDVAALLTGGNDALTLLLQAFRDVHRPTDDELRRMNDTPIPDDD